MCIRTGVEPVVLSLGTENGYVVCPKGECRGIILSGELELHDGDLRQNGNCRMFLGSSG